MRTRNGELAKCTAHCQCGCEYKYYGKCLSEEDCKAQKWSESVKQSFGLADRAGGQPAVTADSI